MPSKHADDLHAVSAWIPLAQWLALRAAAGLLGCTVSDLVKWCIERHAGEVIREEQEKRDEYARRLVARIDKGSPRQC
jgi:glutamyl-tRNA reductase